ncbi:MAG: protein kinase [Gammaproteobacteria bacterium]
MAKEQEKSHAEFVALVEQALTLPPAARLEWLEERAPKSAYTDVGRMLALAQANSIQADGWPTSSVDLLGQRVGAYRLTARLGEGGAGQVYRAERCDGQFEQTVAIKVLTAQAPSATVTAQFEYERQLLASLHHPNIAALLGGGTEDNLHYAVMEFIDGVPLHQYLTEQRPDAHRIVNLFISICHAIQSAHEALVVHRDIKPQNILIAQDGQPKLVDFGIARRLSTSDPASATILAAMTPEYASPEQLRGDPLTTATDIYSLGVVLYEALCGSLPFNVQGQSAASHLKRLEETAVVPPSLKMAAGAAHQRDLDAVVIKALVADTDGRYRSADALARDLRCVLEGKPVAAKAPSAFYRLRRLVSRHRTAAAGIGLALVAVIGGLGATLWQASVARVQTDAARQQLQRAEVVSAYLGDVLAGGGDPWTLPSRRGNADASVSETLDTVESSLEAALENYPDVRIEFMTRLSEAYLYLNRGERAAELMYEAIDVADERLPALSPLRVDVRYHLGSAFLDEDMYAESLEMMIAALAVSQAQGTLGNLRWIYIMTEMALAYSGTGNFERALAVHLEAEARWFELAGDEPMPAWAEGFQSRAYFEFALGDLAAAQRSLDQAQRAIRQFPDQTRIARSGVFALEGRVAYHSKQPERARQAFLSAVQAAREEFTDYGDGYPLLATGSQLAIVQCESGQLEAPAQLLDELAELLPQHLLFGDGWIYHQARAECANASGDFSAALEHAAEAERLGRAWPYLLAHVARRQRTAAQAYAGLGDQARARRAAEASRALYAAWLKER